MPTYSTPGVYVSEAAFRTNVARANTSQSVGAFFGTASRGPVTPTLINSWSAFKTAYGDVSADHELGYSVYHYFANGGRDAYIVRVASATADDATSTIAYYPNGTESASAALFTSAAQSVGAWGNNLTVVVSNGVIAGSSSQIPTFNLSVRLSGTEVERWNEVSTDPASNRYLDTVVNTYSKFITVTTNSGAKTAHTSWAFDTSDEFAYSGGSDGSAVSSSDYVTAINSRLETVEGVLLINAPGQTTSTVVNALLAKAEARGNSFVIIDPSADTDAATIGGTVVGTYSQSSYGAVYYPMLKMADPTKSGPAAIRNTYPGGAVAGAFIRSEVSRSVAKAPAGYGLDIRNSYGLLTKFTPTEADTLYGTYNVNLFKEVPGGGIIVNGARTLEKSSPGKYIPIRRSLNYLKQVLNDRTAFAVFEPNDERLWTTLTMKVSSVLGEFWRSGGLKGASPDQAFYIICDSTNNTEETISQGEVRIEVGVALQYPAEFIVISISQWTGGANSASSI